MWKASICKRGLANESTLLRPLGDLHDERNTIDDWNNINVDFSIGIKRKVILWMEHFGSEQTCIIKMENVYILIYAKILRKNVNQKNVTCEKRFSMAKYKQMKYYQNKYQQFFP